MIKTKRLRFFKTLKTGSRLI